MIQFIAYASFIASLFWMGLGRNAQVRTARAFVVLLTFIASVIALAVSH